jgi:hypothetical protein
MNMVKLKTQDALSYAIMGQTKQLTSMYSSRELSISHPH